MEKQKEITLTKKQFLTLLKTVYLGNWLANAIRTGRPDDKHIKEYEDMEDLFFLLQNNLAIQNMFMRMILTKENIFQQETLKKI